MRFKHLVDLITPFLKEHNINLGYQRRGCKKQGHYKEYYQDNKVIKKEILIEQDENDAGKVYVLIHELTHVINNHLHDKTLTKPQKEVVADQVAKHFINKWELINDIKTSNIYIEQDLLAYSQKWLNNRQFSDKKSEIINKQIEYSIYIINQLVE